ncbi:MAG: hypothetical protein H7A23_03325 [Leptospiraceae bacterium]|nr:hypothetical protein [Leptospiraceae bacterium]MCP5493561.1 hypothetical protein [Leptospiraceae bacterium]
MQDELNVYESHLSKPDSNLVFITPEFSFKVGDFSNYIKECEASEDMTEEEFLEDIGSW